MKLLSKTKYFLLLLVLLFSACEEEVDSEALVFTEDVIFVSGEILRVTGRVVAAGAVPASDHGFEIAEDDAFSSPITISLGERSVPGRFIGSHEGLNTETEYFVRAFAIIDGTPKYGATLEFSTLGSEFSQFTPTTENVGGSVTIFGRNLTADVEVFFGEVKAEILEFKFESVVRVRIPSPRNQEFIVPIRIISDGKELVSTETFEYIVGKWTKISDFPGAQNFSRNTFFTFDSQLYTGINQAEGGDPQSFWKFDPVASTWSQTNFGGTFVTNPGAFEGGFLGGEISFFQTYFISNEFWTLNSNGEFESEGTVPFQLHRPVTFREGDDLFVFGGWDTNGNFKSDVWKYNFISKSWVLFDSAPVDIFSHLPFFKKDGLMYFVGSDNRLFSYDAQTKAWNELASYPGESSRLALGVTIGDYAYVGLSGQDRIIYEYSFANDSWKMKIPILGFNSDVVLAYHVYNDKLYVLRSRNIGTQAPELYEFEPFEF